MDMNFELEEGYLVNKSKELFELPDGITTFVFDIPVERYKMVYLVGGNDRQVMLADIENVLDYCLIEQYGDTL